MLQRRRPHPPSRSGHGIRAVGIAAVAVILLLVASACGGGSGASRAQTTVTRAPVALATSVPAVETTSTSTPAAQASPTPTLSVVLPVIQPDPSRLQAAHVVRVIDGDTIVVRIGGEEEHVRYYGIDTPERGEPCYSDATDRNRELIGQSVLLLPDARNRDRYGRLLRYVFDASGTSVDARLIGEGYAHAWRQDGAYRDRLVALEDEAQAAKAGCLWITPAP